MPPALRQALASGLRSYPLDIEAGGGVRLSEDLDWIPPQVSGEVIAAAQTYAEALRDHLRPMGPERLGFAIGRLLAHNWRSRRDNRPSAETQEAIIIDWIEDLDFPEWAISAAMRQWRRSEPWQPTIADIRHLCEFQVEDDARMLRLIEKLLVSQERTLKLAG